MLKENQNEIADENELVVSRVLNAPREVVFSVWTDPKHIVQWWGPEGFTNTIHDMDVKPGGHWKFIMHGPDGKSYRNESMFVEVLKNEKIVYDHISGPKFRGIAMFESAGKNTKVTLRMVFPTVELRNKTVKEF
jgi:uncharacterized protein YndB with AHSA1/START domain